LPDLLSQYAIERAHVDDSPRARRRARQRLVEVVPAGSTATLVDRWSPRLA
jgi:hypothetical protein